MVKISTNPRRGSGRAGLVAREGKADLRDGGLGGAQGRATSRVGPWGPGTPTTATSRKKQGKKNGRNLKIFFLNEDILGDEFVICLD